MTISFNEWLDAELKRKKWKTADLTRHANIGTATLNNIRSGQRKPGLKVCQKIAEAFGVPAEDAYRAAGLLPPEPKPGSRAETAEKRLLDAYRQLDEQGQKEALKIVNVLKESHKSYNTPDKKK